MKLSIAVISILVIFGAIWLYVSKIVPDGTWNLSVSTWIFMVGAVILAFAIGGALMALLFYSNRSGHDDDAHGS